MPQSDGQVQNANFPAFRTDLNDNLAALFSQSSGASAPAVTQPFQPWIDTNTSPATWYIRNAANTGWITIGTIDATTFSTGGVTAIANGGTGQTTATAALTALLPSQAGNAGKALVTDGSLAGWGAITTSQAYTFTASGTWTKPSQGTFAMVYIWGAGGSGGRNSVGAPQGGGGGACSFGIYKLADLPGTVSITVGAGGASRTVNAVGMQGGSSLFGSLLIAYGGGGGGIGNVSATYGGQGGSDLATGISSTGTNTGSAPILDGGGGSNYDNTVPAGRGSYGGGGGGTYYYPGGSSFYGGGGGGGGGTSTRGLGGTSVNGGDGGDGAIGSAAAGAGSTPGGGGGGSRGNSGAGGDGLCLIYVW